ncbi:MAG: hypothetical protein JWP57_4380 [Spirosoma sp.]|nr:hypothetical protein [Spirosoma sp.]
MGALTPAEFAVLLDRAGITESKPLYAVMVATFEATSGARGLTPEGEKNLVARVAGAVRAGAEQAGAQAYRQGRMRTLAVQIGVGVAVLAGGWALGYWQRGEVRVEAIAGASFVAQLVTLNDPAALRTYCMAHAYQQAGGTACQLPPVWVGR